MLKSFSLAVALAAIPFATPASAAFNLLTTEMAEACRSGSLDVGDAVSCSTLTPEERAIVDKDDFWMRAQMSQITEDELSQLGRWYGAGKALASYCTGVNGRPTLFYYEEQVSPRLKDKAFKAQYKLGQTIAKIAIKAHKKLVTQGVDVTDAPADSWFCTHAYTDYGLILGGSE